MDNMVLLLKCASTCDVVEAQGKVSGKARKDSVG